MGDLKEAILARVNIAELIGQYVTLKQAGREFKGRCPFHDETAASFHVNPEKGLFHCFGCKAGGTVIDFVMRAENLEFVEALEWLASKYHIEVPRTPGQAQARGRKERLYQLNEAALKLFRQWLRRPEGEAARAYLERRGIGDRLQSDFDLGFAPREWQALTDIMLERGAKSGELAELGLIKHRRSEGVSTAGTGEGRGFYDAFRHRLIFPIRSAVGRVIGFAGRALSDEDTPKYLNVTNTPLYDKSSVLYNLDRAKGVLRDEGAVVVEGYMDVIGLAGAGVDNAVATCGTALTAGHVHLLSRYTDRFFLAFDGDEAGARAAWTAGTLFLKAGLNARVVALPEGLDPDDLVRQRGRAAWQGLLSEATGVVRFWLDRQRIAHPEPDLTIQRRWVQQLSPLYMGVPDELARQEFTREVASALRLGAAEVAALLSGVRIEPAGGVKLKRRWQAQRHRRAEEYLAPELYPREGEMVEQLLTEQALDRARQSAIAQQQRMALGASAVEREVARRLLDDEQFRFVYLTLAEEEPVAEWFADQQLRAVFVELTGGAEPEALVHDDRFSALCAELLNREPLLDDQEQLYTRHRNEYFLRREAEVSAELRRAIADKDEQRQSELFAQLSRVKAEVRPVAGGAGR